MAKGRLVDGLITQASIKLMLEMQKRVGSSTIGSESNPISKLYMRDQRTGESRAVQLDAEGNMLGTKILRTYYRSRG